MTSTNKNDTAELIKSIYLVDEEEILYKYIKEFRKWVALTKSGKIIFESNTTDLSQKLKVALYTVGKKLASKAQLVNEETVTTEELADALGLEGKVISARASELKKEDILEEVSKGTYKINLRSLDKLISELSEKV